MLADVPCKHTRDQVSSQMIDKLMFMRAFCYPWVASWPRRVRGYMLGIPNPARKQLHIYRRSIMCFHCVPHCHLLRWHDVRAAGISQHQQYICILLCVERLHRILHALCLCNPIVTRLNCCTTSRPSMKQYHLSKPWLVWPDNHMS